MITIKPVRALRDLELTDHSGTTFQLAEGRNYELHMADAHLHSDPERFYPCEIHALGSADIIGIIDQREAGTLIADGCLI
ncbi:MAG: hypothetical protein RBT81_03355 [Gammaproteobacteria bacterium]|jgi:hypothetical protein|nr:hypothetical protein [Gammaproteobacteria bacterium]